MTKIYNVTHYNIPNIKKLLIYSKMLVLGLLRVNLDNSQVNEMALDEDLIHWEYIRSHIEAIRVPLRFCLASKKEGCPYVVTPCLTCPNFCTTPDNLCDFEREIRRVEEHIQMTQNYPIYNEKTKEQLE